MAIVSGDDIAHLGELDQKLWTVLSCPVDGLEMDRATLELIDADKDGKIKAEEVIAAAQWLTSVVKDKDSILRGESVLKLDNIDTSNPAGEKLYRSACQILSNLGKDSDGISVEDASDSAAIFAGTGFNGDGVITELSTADESLKQIIGECAGKIGSVPDRSSVPGVTAEMIGGFYDACAEYSAWMAAAEADKANVFPYGDDTHAAYVAMCGLRDKVADFHMRCKLIGFNGDAAAAVDTSVERIAAISGQDLAAGAAEIAACPIARPDASAILRPAGINPAWKPMFDSLLAIVGKDLPAADKGIGEADWNALCSRFDAYSAWLSSKKGESVESLGIERVNAILADNRKQDLLDLVDADKALEDESNSIDDVKKLMLFYRDFYRLLKNYVIFSDFYGRASGTRGIFEVGQLYIDQRCCDLCIRVDDMGQHADMAGLSGMFLIYCKCTSKVLGRSMDIVAVMTDGDTDALRPGKNGIFYDCAGHDWDAVVTKVVENPISIGEAFWSPYRKFWAFCVGLINKSAADKDAKMMSDMQSKAETAATGGTAAAAESKPAFDIAKFAGIFAAMGLALGYIGSFLTKLAMGISRTPWWQILVAVAVVMLIISGPSCFIAWSKLRRRNLGPVLNANGWAINSKVLVNILFGNKLTFVAKYPKIRLTDPYVMRTPVWKWILWTVLFLVVLFAVLYFTNSLAFMGIRFGGWS